MLGRPCCCRHDIAVRRLPSLRALPSPIIRQSLASRRPLGADRRLLSTRPELRPWRPKSFRSGIGFLPERTLATALNDYAPLDETVGGSLDPLPNTRYGLLSASSPPPLVQTPPRPLWELRRHTVNAPLIVDEGDGPVAVRQKINTRGIPGDVDEMLAILDACLQVGKLDRAALVLKRLARPEFATDDIDLLSLHNRYLRAALDQLILEPDVAIAEDLHKWYELEIRGKQVGQTPETIALMLKVSLLTARGVRRKRLVERYMDTSPGDAGLEVLYMTGILNDQDRATITDICKTYNLPPTAAQPSTQFEAALRSITPDATTASAEEVAATLPDTPEVLGTPQKGMGLRMLKQTLSLFNEIPEGYDIAKLGSRERREIQSRLEKDCVDAAVERWKEENQALLKMGLNTSLQTASLNSRLYEWHRDLELRILQELEKISRAEKTASKNKEDLDRCMYGPFLRQSPPSRLAAVTIVSTLSSLAMLGADKGVSIGTVVTQIAKVAEEDIRLQQQTKALAAKGQKAAAKAAAKNAAKMALRRSSRPVSSTGGVLPGLKDPESDQAASSAAAAAVAAAAAEATTPPTETAEAKEETEAASSNKVSASPRDTTWPITIKAKVGAALLSLLLETAKVTAVKEHPETRTLLSQQQPAFSRLNQYKKGKKVGMLVANQTLVELMKREPRGDFLARHLPMVVEPEPWVGFEKGGFLEYPAPLVRVKDSRRDQKIYAEAAIARGDMDQVLRGLDVLGRTAWKVNRNIFNVMLEAWNTGEALASIPPLCPDMPTPPEPDSTDDPMVRRTWLKAVKAVENHRSGLHSVRCFMNFQMEIARAFRDQTFYFPHNLDFRGRAYPIPPYFNHMGADHVRGLLTFAHGKKLGVEGLRWLKVHLSNVYGYDKASLTDRAAFADENLDNIRDSAADPLGGRRWWLEAEDPWQCLAACFELRAAMELADPTEYVSSLPVHQDGTCNGLQHYAALGGDAWGAKQVNLEPGDQPSDVYSAVADIVKASIAEDAAAGDANALALDGKIKRKVVKQTVMTNVYGVTFAGARKQVLKQLDALYPTLQAESGIPAMVLASYIATKIFKALATMFSGAHDIQNWLGEIGGRVCRALTPDQVERLMLGGGETDEAAAAAAAATTASGKRKAKKTATGAPSRRSTTEDVLNQFRSTLVWTTPLQMPVVQPYRKTTSRTIETCLQDLILSVPARSDPVHRRKQLQAFPPNFIHSLDASHMLLSALECDELGLAFAAVHDSFWTHAADINTMNRVLRDAFIRIHSEDVVGRLAAEFEARYKGSMYLAQLNRTSPLAKKILELRKKERSSLLDELVREKKRLDLLQSADPALVAEGRAMVTPGSLFAEMMEATNGEAAAAAAADTTSSGKAKTSSTSNQEAILEAEDLSEFQLGSIPASEAAAARRGGSGSSRRSSSRTALEESSSSSAAVGGMGLDGMGTALGNVATGDDDDVDVDGHGLAAEDEALDDEYALEGGDEADEAETTTTSNSFEANLKNLPRTKASKTPAAAAAAAGAAGDGKAKAAAKKTPAKKQPVQVWVPLTFPAIPAKGDFDVRRLKESDYFFS